MKNFVQTGEILTLTAPNPGVVSGRLYVIEDIVVAATVTAETDAPFAAFVGPGVITYDKPDDEAWTEGVKLYFDESEDQVTTDDDTAANPLIGVAAAAAATSDTTGKVRLDGVAR